MKLNYNEVILSNLASCGTITKEGRLNYRKETKKYFKERWFKLRANLLFYYKTNDFGIICENDPKGCLVLVRYSVQMEVLPDASFGFSIILKCSDEKHYFSGQNTIQCQEWVNALCSANLYQELDDLKTKFRQRQFDGRSGSCKCGPSSYKKTNKAVIPKRYEKKILVVEEQSKKDCLNNGASKTFSSNTVWHIPRVKSSSALEQVRKNYSLAALMLDESNDNKSTQNNLISFSSSFDPKQKESLSQSVTIAPLKKNFSNLESLCQDSSLRSQSSTLVFNPAFLDMCGDSKSESNQHSIAFSKQIASLKQPESVSQRVGTINLVRAAQQIPNNCSSELQRKPVDSSQQIGIILQPLSLFSDPFLNSYIKNEIRPKSASHQRSSLIRQGQSLIEPPLEVTELPGLIKPYQRPRSSTLAQLEAIPDHLIETAPNNVVVSHPSETEFSLITNSGMAGNINGRQTSKSKPLFQNWETFDD